MDDDGHSATSDRTTGRAAVALFVASFVASFVVGCSRDAPLGSISPPGNASAKSPVHRCSITDWTKTALPALRVGHARPKEGAKIAVSMTRSPGGTYVATSVGPERRLWDARSGALLRDDLPGDRFVDETHVVGAPDGRVESLDVTTGTKVAIPFPPQAAALSPDGRLVARIDGGVTFVDSLRGEVVDRANSTSSSLTPSPGSAFLFETGEETTTSIWSWTTKRPLLVLDSSILSPDSLQGYRVSADGARACVVGSVSLRVIDLTTGAARFTRKFPSAEGTFSSGMVPLTVQDCVLSKDHTRVAFVATRPSGFHGFAASDSTVEVADDAGASLLKLDVTGVDTIELDATGSAVELSFGNAPGIERRCEAHAISGGPPTACTPPASPATTDVGEDGKLLIPRADGTSLTVDITRGIVGDDLGQVKTSAHPYVPKSSSNPSRVTTSPDACGGRRVLARSEHHVLVEGEGALYDCMPEARFPDAMRALVLDGKVSLGTAMYSDDERILAIGDASNAQVFDVESLAPVATVPSGHLARVFGTAALFTEPTGGLVAYRWADCSTLRLVHVRDGAARGWVAAVGDDVEADAVGATFLPPASVSKTGIVAPFFTEPRSGQ